MFSSLVSHIDSIIERDPAETSRLEVLLCYSGLHAIWFHRFNHWVWGLGLKTLARFLSQLTRFLTGVEIHPGAKLGKNLFIDHGMGLVIGETTIIGDDVTLFQGVTLGGTGKLKHVKRHPTLGSGVVVGVGASVLGDITIGDNTRIAAGSIVLNDMPSNCTVIGVPGRVVLQNGQKVVIADPKQYGDPIFEQLERLKSKIEWCEHQLNGQSIDTEKPEEFTVVSPDYCI